MPRESLQPDQVTLFGPIRVMPPSNHRQKGVLPRRRARRSRRNRHLWDLFSRTQLYRLRGFGCPVEPTDRLLLLFDLPGFRLFFLLRPLDKSSGRFVVHARPTPPTEVEIPADGDLKGFPQPLRQLCSGQNRVPVWEMNLLHDPQSLPNKTKTLSLYQEATPDPVQGRSLA